ncbi:MAG: hypothetical protein ACKOSS_10925 [Planctomycetia bacterium]
MGRKSSDMLEALRAPSPAPRPAPAPRARASEGAGGASLLLSRRQMSLAGALVVVLLAFSFVLGLSVGRRGERGTAGGTPSLSREAPRDLSGPRLVYIEGRVPYMDPARQAVNDPGRLRDALVRQKGLPDDRVWVMDDLAAAMLRVVVGPFPSEAQAAEFLRRTGLFTFRLGGVLPWKAPDYLWMHEGELPTQRLPLR